MQFLLKEEDFKISSNIHVIYFYTTWMIYHKKMMIVFDKIEKKYNQIDYMAIDADYFKGLCKRFLIESVPTIIFFKNGKEVKKIDGLISTNNIVNILDDISNLDF